MPRRRNAMALRTKVLTRRPLASPTILGVIQAAALRINPDRRSHLERLPNELKRMIIAELPGVRIIDNLALTGPEFCYFIATNEKIIAKDVFKVRIPPSLQHVAVATYAALMADWNCHRLEEAHPANTPLDYPYISSIIDFVERYRLPNGFALETQHPGGLLLKELNQYLVIYSSISQFSVQLATGALAAVPGILGFTPHITPTVLVRYQKALYILQLVSELFSLRGREQNPWMHMAWGSFWRALEPWEMEQVFGAQVLLKEFIAANIGREFEKVYWREGDPQHSMAKFVVFYGPARLWALHVRKQGSISLGQSYLAFRKWNQSDYIAMPVCAPGFGLDISLRRIGKKLREWKKGTPFPYNELDYASMKHWFHIYLYGKLENRQLRTGPYSFFACFHCLTNAGYAFWDNMGCIRLPAPAMLEMHRMTVEKFRNAANTYVPPNRIGAPWWYRQTDMCLSQSYLRFQLVHQLDPSREYCYHSLGQALSEEEELQRLQEEIGPMALVM
ncbi:hypothetical protein NUW58_g2775 [Xylaria curta]|uniref:Uncharacterized protein n=1 Tax=Xylaria curta TaxID=42375 RepID=A0ACC1PE05_9PEZI|nr:hypothetical protein NUW58_g2775 [Xylaria curta]